MKFVLFSLMTLLAVPALSSELSDVDANLRCEAAGGGVAVKYPTASSPARAWLTDSQKPQGLEIKLSDFKQARCPGCLEFTGENSGIKLRAVVQDSAMTLYGLNPATSGWEVLFERLACE